MKSINKILISILLMSILVITATVVTSAVAPVSTNTSDNNIINLGDAPVAEIKEAKLPTAAEEKARFEKRKNTALKYTKATKRNGTVQEAQMIPSETPIINTISSDVAYTNPISGISTFATSFYTGSIYDTYYREWMGYSFYLPVAAYVDMKFNGRIGYISDQTYYDMWIDSDWLNNVYDNSCYWEIGADACSTSIQTSRLTYLPKGWHTLYIDGWGGLESGWSYAAQGYSSIVAFPEYTAITVLIPNGGENWSRGTTKSITWKKDGQPGANVKIELYKAGVLSTVISSLTPNDGVYGWYIPTYTPIGTDYKIKISSTSEPTKYYDWSNNNFKIS